MKKKSKVTLYLIFFITLTGMMVSCSDENADKGKFIQAYKKYLFHIQVADTPGNACLYGQALTGPSIPDTCSTPH